MKIMHIQTEKNRRTIQRRLSARQDLNDDEAFAGKRVAPEFAKSINEISEDYTDMEGSPHEKLLKQQKH